MHKRVTHYVGDDCPGGHMDTTAFRHEYEQRFPPPQPMCPHCGALPGVDERGLIADHDEPERPNLCPGSYQVPRNHEADRRRLWNGQPNPHIEPRR